MLFRSGARPFAYAAPAGFKSLNTANLPTPTILAGNTAFDTKLYTGNGGSQSISGLAFSPDFVWLKSRSNTQSHYLFDVIRDAGILSSDTTNAESTGTDWIDYNSDGFTSKNGLSSNGYTYAAWCWDAGSSTVTNTAGSITSTVRANASAGFSVCTFTTQSSGTGTFGHGLNVAPQLVITKARAVANNWITYHASVGNTGALLLNSTAATDTQSFYWNNTSPTSSVVTLGSGFGGSNSLVAYCFAPVSGYSSFGSYAGTGSDVFVYTGFRPRWVMIKYSSGSASGIIDWGIWDAARGPYNVNDPYLGANVSDAEATSAFRKMDFVSNGFVLKGSGVSVSGNTYIYAAFAENPFSIARAR